MNASRSTALARNSSRGNEAHTDWRFPRPIGFIGDFRGIARCETERLPRSIIKPRVAPTRYPGYPGQEILNPERVAASQPGAGVGVTGYNPFRVVASSATPRVAPAARPWAGGFERRWRSPEIRDYPKALLCPCHAPLAHAHPRTAPRLAHRLRRQLYHQPPGPAGGPQSLQLFLPD